MCLPTEARRFQFCAWNRTEKLIFDIHMFELSSNCVKICNAVAVLRKTVAKIRPHLIPRIGDPSWFSGVRKRMEHLQNNKLLNEET